MIEFISQLPTEYQEVEYLENSGTQYIVVDFIPNQDTRLDMLVEPRSVAAAESGVGFIPYGSGESYNSKTFECYTNAEGKLEFNYGGQYQTDLANVSVGTKINISHNKNNILVTNTNGQTIASHSFNYTAFTCPRNLTLFAINRSTALVGQTRIYSCQIYNDTTLALALVPCYRKSDNVAGLYDLVNNVFYTNAGSGVFVVGADSNKHAIATITPGGVISFGAALRRRMMMTGGGGAPISDLPLGALINVGTDGGDGAPNYEIADKDNLVSGGIVLVRKNVHSTSEFGSTVSYPNSTLDNLITTTIYNQMPSKLRDIMMDVSFPLYSYLLSDSENIIRKMFALTYIMVGFYAINGVEEGKALQLYTSEASRKKTFEGNGREWWLSSQDSKYDVMYVTMFGGSVEKNPSSVIGVVPAFVIPSETPYNATPNTDGSYNLIL